MVFGLALLSWDLVLHFREQATGKRLVFGKPSVASAFGFGAWGVAPTSRFMGRQSHEALLAKVKTAEKDHVLPLIASYLFTCCHHATTSTQATNKHHSKNIS